MSTHFSSPTNTDIRNMTLFTFRSHDASTRLCRHKIDIKSTARNQSIYKRLHTLRVLRREGIPPHELITIYYALIRSMLEYCCAVWHRGLPLYCGLSEQVHKIQKRALRITVYYQADLTVKRKKCCSVRVLG